jgi:hypothetical protein
MTSGTKEPSYALSFISYARPHQRQSFFAFAELLSQSIAAMFDGRLHWGKVCPLSPSEIGRLYSALPQFREVCNSVDPKRTFRNDWVERTLFSDTN